MPDTYRFDHSKELLLTVAARYVRVTAEQFTRHPDTSTTIRTVRRKLAELVADDYLTANKGFSQSANPPLVYTPTLRGWRRAQELHGTPIPTRWRPSEARITDYRDYLHDLAITDFGLNVERFCREAEPNVRFVRFLHDRFMPQTRVTLPDLSTRAMRLDGFLELRVMRGTPPRPKQRCHVLELDRGTHFKKAAEEKILSQVAYHRGGHFEADFGTPALTFVWVCPGGTERVAQLLKWVEAVLEQHDLVEYGQLFLLTAANPASTDPVDFFTGDHFSVPYEQAPVSLLGYVPQAALRHQSHYLPQEQYDRFLASTGATPMHVAAELDAS